MKKDFVYRNKNILFFGFTLLITYISWLPLTFSSQGLLTFPNFLLYLIGGLGPALAAIGLITVFHTKPEKKEYWKKLVNFKGIGVKWYLIILSYPLLTFVALILHHLIMGEPIAVSQTSDILNQPSFYFFYFLPVMIGVIGEEPGWRGYMLRYMSRKHSLLTCSLVIGVIWAAWHIPLFFIKETYQYGVGVLNLPFAVFMLELIPQSILLTWVFFKTGRSTLAAVLLHFIMNINPVDDLFDINVDTQIIRFLIYIFISVLVVVFAFPKMKTKDMDSYGDMDGVK